MLKNFWYAVEFSAAVTSAPQPVKLMGENYVLYRGHHGQVVAMADRCIHRGAALSGGWVEGNCLRCPYHGWRYEADGTCVQIPADQAGTPIPKRARVDTFPVEERYGMVWMFVGDLPAEQRPPIPSLPEYGDPKWRAITGEYSWNAHYTRIPVDENTTLTKWIGLRNFLPQAWADWKSRKNTNDTYREDKAVIESQVPCVVPLTGEILLASDSLQLAYRKLIRQCVERGWAVGNDYGLPINLDAANGNGKAPAPMTIG